MLGICKQLKDILCVVKLAKILGHAGITGNVIADHEAKEAAKKLLLGNLKHQQQYPSTMLGNCLQKLQ